MREGLTVEFKRQYTKDVIKSVIAFANTSGGKMFIGVEDDGIVKGLANPDEVILAVTNAIRDMIKPDLTLFTTVTSESFTEGPVVVIEVQKGPSSPYYWAEKGLKSSGVFVRQGAATVPASDAAILKMIKETDGDCYETLRSQNQDLSFDTLKKAFRDANVPLEAAQMKTFSIVDQNDQYTNLGLLLSDQCVHTIKVAVFEGTTKEIFKNRYEFSGSLLRQLDEVYAFLDRYNRTHSKINGLLRTDTRDYPEVAIRETLINAIVHRDYAFNSSILISIFDDRIECVSVGGLAKGISRDDMLLGVSITRNNHLADVFYRLRLIEAYGTGILRMLESYANHPVKPTIDISSNAFKITLPSMHPVSIPYPEENTLNPSEEKVMELFEAYTTIKRELIQNKLSISQSMAVNLLRSLQDKSKVMKLGQGKNTVYRRVR